MSFILGNIINTDKEHDVYQIKGKSDSNHYNYRTVFAGPEHVWPDYVVGAIDGSLNQRGYDNESNGNFNLSNMKFNDNREDETLLPEICQAGADIDFMIDCRESSSWHYLSFSLIVPKGMVLDNIYETNDESSILINEGEQYLYCDVQLDNKTTKFDETLFGPLSAYHKYDIRFREDFECQLLDGHLQLYFKVKENDGDETIIRAIIFDGFRDEHDNLVDNSNYIITYYRQNTNFRYTTYAAWMTQEDLGDGLDNIDFKKLHNTLEVSPTSTSTTVYLAIVFGISNGLDTYYGPPNDHLNSSGNISMTEGNILTDVRNYLTVYAKPEEYDIDDNYSDILFGNNGENITIEESLGQYGYYIVPITLNYQENNSENNQNGSAINYYFDTDESSYFYSENRLPGGNSRESNIYASRQLPRFMRSENIAARSLNLYANFSYGKHNFKI